MIEELINNVINEVKKLEPSSNNDIVIRCLESAKYWIKNNEK